MNDGVALLLERMKTHPEEFESNVIGKWSHIINSYKQYLEEEDCKALDAGINALMQQHFTEKVMEELVDPKKSSLELLRLQVKQNATLRAGTTLTLSSMASSIGGMLPNDPTITNYFPKEENKEHKTLFGRLWNYL